MFRVFQPLPFISLLFLGPVTNRRYVQKAAFCLTKKQDKGDRGKEHFQRVGSPVMSLPCHPPSQKGVCVVTVFSHFRDVSASVCVCSGYYYRLGVFSSMVPNYQEKKVNLSSCWEQHQTQAEEEQKASSCVGLTP